MTTGSLALDRWRGWPNTDTPRASHVTPFRFLFGAIETRKSHYDHLAVTTEIFDRRPLGTPLLPGGSIAPSVFVGGTGTWLSWQSPTATGCITTSANYRFPLIAGAAQGDGGYWVDFLSRMNKFFRADPGMRSDWVRLDSCFGTLAIYSAAAYFDEACAYDTTGADCEHVLFHRCLARRGWNRVYLNPRMVVHVDL